jgi:hypothetical protein
MTTYNVKNIALSQQTDYKQGNDVEFREYPATAKY